MTNVEIRNIRPEGGDVRFEEVDLDAEREKTQDANMDASIVVNGIAQEYGAIADEASSLLEEYGQDPDLSVSLSGLSEIMQSAANKSIELKARSEPGTAAEAMLGSKTAEEFKEDHEYALEGMRNTLNKMKAIVGAVNRQDRLDDARDDVEEVHAASEIVQDKMLDGQPKTDQTAAQKEREAAIDAAQKKLDLKSIAKLLKEVSTVTPTLVAEHSGGLNKLLDGDGKETYKATFDMTTQISETAAVLSRRISAELENFIEAGIDVGQIKQLAANLQALSENTKKRANEASADHRGVSKRGLGRLREQLDQLEDVKLLFSPNNAVGTVARGGKSVDASKRLGQLRKS